MNITDTVSLNILYKEDSIKEIDNLLNDKTFFITPDGEVTYSIISETLKYVVGYMSKTFEDTLSIEESVELSVETRIDSIEDIHLKPLKDEDLIDGYQISDTGDVYRITTDRKGKEVINILSLHTTRLGYVEAILAKRNGKKKHLQVHRLVAEYFLGLPEDEKLTDVNHKDGDRSNNTVNNVEYMTHSDNVLHSYRELR